ncbi:HxlR family transcriptional regulator [Chitinophaga skermanii]|uniref:HxlR family transcriptional regulator n=1 Tax=Chitinophaga skermanii TaxID=331697 RepID=A0A327QQB7_9BACT|nr:helix-turn-helix domain-containing protein [Chitinophaga skermanii]RAJ05543.1 HxlR family transcriptional regulator [Chitinophaga skermanii]
MRKSNSTYTLNETIINATCGTAVTLALIGGRWKLNILWILLEGKSRFSEIKKKMPLVSERMLALQLKELEKAKIIERTVYPEVPPRVEYELTEIGQSMIPMLRVINAWGAQYQQQVKEGLVFEEASICRSFA